jgi:hypothetical protein
MINETRTFPADSHHKIIVASAILQKFCKRTVASMNDFTDIGDL